MTPHVCVTLAPLLAGQVLTALKKSRGSETVENVAFGLARPFTHANRTVLRVEEILEFSPNCYQVREHYAVQLAPHALARVVAQVRERQLIPVKFHRHPLFSGRPIPHFSTTDDAADAHLKELFSGDGGFASILYADTPEGGYTVTARAAVQGALKPALVIERRLPHVVHPTQLQDRATDPKFDRACLSFGAGVISTLAQARVGVVGCGGLGWHSSCAAANSGVGSLLLLDRDVMTLGNLPRLEGSRPEDVGKAKVDRLRQYLLNRYEDLDVPTLNLDVVDILDHVGQGRDELLQALGSCDLLLLVTDNHPSRLAVLAVAEALGVPYVHCGMHQIGPEDMFCRLSVHNPGLDHGCGVCVGHIDQVEGSRRGHGYIEGVRQPNVAAWNAVAAGYTVNALRQVLVPLEGDCLRSCSAWEIGLSSPSVRVIDRRKDPRCTVCG